jgi:hypothetical protein
MGDIYDDGKLGAIRNPQGIWINSQVFKEEATNFKKYGKYCADPEGSPDWEAYWKLQRRRCRDGYSVGGVRITGDHYTYLNFCPILKVDEKDGPKARGRQVRKGAKETDFPDFWDGDYNFYWAREIARNGVIESGLLPEEEAYEVYNLPDAEQLLKAQQLFESLGLAFTIEPDYLFGGYNLIVGKSRQRGYSYKNASVGVGNYLTRPNLSTIFGAEDKKYLYPKGIFTMANNMLNFIGQHTPWVYPRDVINQASKGHYKASTLETRSGVQVEVGFMSEIISLTFSDNPDAARGKNAHDLIFEESGSFGTPGLLKDSYKASEDCVMSGDMKTGLITIFGTSGDMEGGTADYAEMHSEPLRFGLLPFQNIWDKDSSDMKCGFFHPVNWNMQGYYDAQGNSDIEGAKQAELNIRKVRLDHGATSADIQARMQEKPLGPFEAFGMVSVNNFPVLELKRQLEIVKAKNLHMIMGTPVKMWYDFEKKKVCVDPILDGTANVIYRQKPDNTSLEGCPVIYEYPADTYPRGAYKIGYDPYRQDKGTSLSAVYVYKSVIAGERTKRVIVAEYVGRPNEADDVNYIARLFAELYNTTIMHENEVTHVKDYFRRRKQLHFLAYQPDEVIKKNVKNSKVNRIWGCHMIDQLKDAGEKYLKSWLLEVLDFDENGDPIRGLDQIYSIGLLEELISYNRKGNFDRVMAMMQVMFQDQEDLHEKVYDKNKQNKNAKALLDMMDGMYSKNNQSNLRKALN